jgi:dihydroorotase
MVKDIILKRIIMPLQITLPKWYDLHVHLRQGELLPAVIAGHLKSQCAGVLAMPNTAPPVAKVLARDSGIFWSIEGYKKMIMESGGEAFSEVIVPLYLTKETTPEMIKHGVESGLLKACKYYPPHGTTNSDHGRELDYFVKGGVIEAMAKYGVVLCIHGEEHGLDPQQYFDRKHNAEELFYQTKMLALHAKYPSLKIVCEHLTTKVAVDFVKASNENVTATITPQHLIYTVGDLLKGMQYHLYCLPLLKFEEDRKALQIAAVESSNTKFFAGTDSAPHTKKATDCGCAAGCYTASIAPQMYAEAFELAGVDMASNVGQVSYRKFLCEIGPNFYGIEIPSDTFVLEKTKMYVEVTETSEGELTPLPVGLNPNHQNEPTSLNWCIR